MFWIKEDMVFYKTERMTSAVLWGGLYLAEYISERQIEDNCKEERYEIKKFNLETEQYEHSDEKDEFEIDGKIVPVVDGFATVTKEPEPIEPEPQPTEQEILMQTLADMELSNIEAQQERQMLAQQVADLELMILERSNG